MDKRIVKFSDTETEKHKFHQHKRPSLTNNIHIGKVVVPNKVSFCRKGFKYFIDYNDSKKC